jgi:hypothetical protein
MSLRLATVDENARSALDCGREAAAFSSFPSAHAPKTSDTKAVAAATVVHQSAFGTAIFIAEAQGFENKRLFVCVSAPRRRKVAIKNVEKDCPYLQPFAPLGGAI